MYLYIILTILVLFSILSIFLSFKYSKKRQLPLKRKHFYINKIWQIKNEEYSKQIIMYDSMLSNILKELSYEWWLWEQLRRKPKIIFNKINSIWELHKLRNKIAHELWEINNDILKKWSIKYENILLEILHEL